MKSHYLASLFNPSSIAVIGASDRPHSVGMKVFKNLLEGNFLGTIYAVNPKHKNVQGQACFASIKEITKPVDLVIITTKAQVVPTVVAECGEKGVRTAIIISSGFSETGKAGKELEQSLLEMAHRYQMRLIGPNCLGVMRPPIKMNATFDNNNALSGHLAFVSQSGALSAAILDWAIDKDIGFSALVSLGNSIDIDFGDVLDYLSQDENTQSILLYIEGIHNARNFMSGLRAAARRKPVVAIKAGRHPQGSRAALSHTGALIGDDDVFDAALRQAGVLRVLTIEELFSATEILASNYRVKGNRLAIITNGGGAGVMAADRAAELKTILPPLNKTIVAQLNNVLPAQWSHQNPIDIIGDATPERYHATLDICSKEDNFDALLMILVPVAMSQPLKVAEQIIKDSKNSDKPILACWMGKKQVTSSWKLFEKHNIPYFDTPEKAVQAFSYLADYQHNQQLLSQIAASYYLEPKSNLKNAKELINSVLAEKRSVLTALESKKILQTFSIPVTESINASTQDEALAAAKSLGFPVVMKINSPDISHKRDVGGVELNIANEEAVSKTFNKILNNAKAARPKARVFGVTVESMFKNPNDRELMIGVVRDIVFGPVISFGSGGSWVEIIKDRALALPPLNEFLAKQLITQTKIFRMLESFRNMPPVDLNKIIKILLRVSEMVCELPFIREMDINPIIVNENEIVAVDARIVVAESSQIDIAYSHMAISPL